MPDYLVKQPLNFDHEAYEVDDTVTMSAKDAQALLDIDVLEVAKKPKQAEAPKKPAVEKPTDESVLLAAIASAVPSLDKSDDSLWTKDKKAQLAALTDVLGYDVSAKERDAAVPPVTEPVTATEDASKADVDASKDAPAEAKTEAAG